MLIKQIKITQHTESLTLKVHRLQYGITVYHTYLSPPVTVLLLEMPLDWHMRRSGLATPGRLCFPLLHTALSPTCSYWLAGIKNRILSKIKRSSFTSSKICFQSNLKNERILKCPYYGFLKMTFHAVCNTALSEWKHPAKFYIWKCTVYKVIVSQKKESTLNHWNKSFL